MPKGYKAYSKTKTIQDYEFELEKKWWNNRKKNENAWLVTIKDIKDNNFDMDFKNPNLKILAKNLFGVGNYSQNNLGTFQLARTVDSNERLFDSPS